MEEDSSRGGEQKTQLHIIVVMAGALTKKTIPVTVDGNCHDLLTDVAKQSDVEIPLDPWPIIYLQEKTVDRMGEEKTTIQVFEEILKHYNFIDPEDGWQTYKGCCKIISIRFLRPSSPLLTCPFFPPVYNIEPDAELLTIGPDGQLQPAPRNALTDPAYIVLMTGNRVEGKMFWQSEDFNYFNAESGKEIGSEVFMRKADFYALLRDNETVPRAKLPKDKILFVFRRRSLDLRMEEDRVRCAEWKQPTDLEVWDHPMQPDAFLTDFMAAVRKE